MRYCTMFMVCVGLSCAAVAAPITTGSLIDEMADLHRLANFPAPGFKTVQFSSYDRRSSVPGGKDWFANADGFGREPIPGFEAVIKDSGKDVPGEYLICDLKGPGAIVRLWTADIAGKIQVFLDGAETPVYDGPAKEFLLHPYATYLEGTGLTDEVLAGAFYQRNASYAPMPFAKRCRIVWVGNEKDTHFYQVQIRKYESGTDVVTFSPSDLKTFADGIRRVASILSDVDNKWPYRSKKSPVPISVTVPPHTVVQGLKIEGGGAIERLSFKVDAANVDEALRQTILHVQFDDHPWPQVQSPIGDFFGAGPGINPYHSLPFTVASDGTMTCRYVMPYKGAVRILFDNRSDMEVTISGSMLPIDYVWDDASSMYFGARWRVNHGLVASRMGEMGAQDIPFLVARGQGVYVGTAIMLLNPCNVPTPDGNWWGEGDEKIFTDDDVRPSIFGTGSEDYFNYAWSEPDIFAFPYCGQPRDDGPANRGFVVNYRWHIVDPLPFTHSLAFYMELFNHGRTEGFSYGRISYCYGREGILDDCMPLTDDDVRMPRLPDTWEPEARRGAKRWVFTACEDIVGEMAATSFEQDPMWQGGRVLVWRPAKPGEELTLTFTAPEDGSYQPLLACMFRPDGGSFRARLDGETVRFEGKDALGLVSSYRALSRVIGAAPLKLTAGQHALTLSAEEAEKPIGLDFFAYQKW